MRTLILIRHGEVTNPNHVVYADLPGFDLSPRGVLEAHAVGGQLGGVPIDAVVSSPLPRALHTAQAVAAHHSLPVLVDDRLVETGMYPRWTGLRWSEVDEAYREQLSGYLSDATALDDIVEPIYRIARRMRLAAYDAFTDTTDIVAIVGHQDPIQALRLDLSGRPLSKLRDDPPGHGSATVLVSTDSAQWVETSTWEPPRSFDQAEWP